MQKYTEKMRVLYKITKLKLYFYVNTILTLNTNYLKNIKCKIINFDNYTIYFTKNVLNIYIFYSIHYAYSYAIDIF